jgi:hypothetical protein
MDNGKTIFGWVTTNNVRIPLDPTGYLTGTSAVGQERRKFYGSNIGISVTSNTTIAASFRSIQATSLILNNSTVSFAAGSQLTDLTLGGVGLGLNCTLNFSNCTSLANVNLGDIAITQPTMIVTFSGCALTQASVDNILEALAGNLATMNLGGGALAGTLTLTGAGNSAPSATGVAARTYIQSRGITVTTN